MSNIPEEKSKLHQQLLKIGNILVLAMAFFHLYTGFVGPYPNIIQRAVHVGFGLAVCFLLGRKQIARNRMQALLDLILVLIVLAGVIYAVFNSTRFLDARFFPNNIDMLLGTLTIIVVLIATKRLVGWFIPILASILMVYAYFGPYFPGFLAHSGLSPGYMIQIIYSSTRGLWGSVTGISANIITMFVIFGSVLLVTGGGQTFIDFSTWIAGSSYGGGGKVAAIASSLFGCVSGSAGANAATTGTLTIPLMKNLGYKKEFAAGIEASASTGGQIVPPIMGAGAFVMAELLGIPYKSIMISAIIPAFLFYLGVMCSIHFEAQRMGYRGLSRDKVPSIREILKPRNSLPVLVPLLVLIYYLIRGYTVTTVAFNATITAIALYFIMGSGTFIHKIKEIIKALESGIKGVITVVALIACSQIVLSMITATGLGVKLSNIVISLGQENMIIASILAMIIAIILGMGLPTVGAYLLAASVLGPALSRLGIEPLAAHFFIFFFAIFAGITPPVCATVYITSAIANSDWIKTAKEAIKLSISAFIIPYVFIQHPGILMLGTTKEIVLNSITSIIGVIGLSAGIMGFLFAKANIGVRILLVCGALALIWPGLQTDLIGLGIIGAAFIFQIKESFKVKKSTTTESEKMTDTVKEGI